MLIVALAAGLLTQFFPCCAFAIRNFSKVSATPEKLQTELAISSSHRTAVVGAPMLRQKLQIELAISSSHRTAVVGAPMLRQKLQIELTISSSHRTPDGSCTCPRVETEIAD